MGGGEGGKYKHILAKHKHLLHKYKHLLDKYKHLMYNKYNRLLAIKTNEARPSIGFFYVVAIV